MLATFGDVRFGSEADIALGLRRVRFTPNSGHPSAKSKCPLWAISRHSPVKGDWTGTNFGCFSRLRPEKYREAEQF